MVFVTPGTSSPVPKVIAPNEKRETRSPVRPKVVYCMPASVRAKLTDELDH